MEMVQRLSLDDYPLAELSEFPDFQNQIAATVENLESSGANETIKAYLASR